MSCTAVPLIERLFYGFQVRESLRVSETLGLDWHDFDLDRSIISLDENKTDDPRWWALSADVAEALRRYRKRFAPRAKPSDLVFVVSEKKVLDRFALAENLRSYLKLAGITRPQLFENNAVRQQLRAHDLRATFVTVSLALGRTEAWITDRTGHSSSQMIYRYKRAARSHAELNLGPLKPLQDAIPELRDFALRKDAAAE